MLTKFERIPFSENYDCEPNVRHKLTTYRIYILLILRPPNAPYSISQSIQYTYPMNYLASHKIQLRLSQRILNLKKQNNVDKRSPEAWKFQGKKQFSFIKTRYHKKDKRIIQICSSEIFRNYFISLPAYTLLCG